MEDTDKKDIDKKLAWALTTGDLEEVMTMLVTTEDVNRSLNSGRSPLHYAADFGQTDVAKYLISKGAQLNTPDIHGFTPLMTACFEGHISCVRLLLEKGANKDLKGPGGHSAIDCDCEEIKALLK